MSAITDTDSEIGTRVAGGVAEDGDADLELIGTVIRNLRVVTGVEDQMRKDMIDDSNFYDGDQWPSQIVLDREAEGRPCLKINRLPQFVRQITNQQRATRPSIQVNPVDSDADVQTAEALQGVIRSIETNSDADVAYSTACEHQVKMGRGYWRILTRYAQDDGFEQDIYVDRINDPLSVYMDPAHTRIDGADARYVIILSDVPKDAFEEEFGSDALGSWSNFMQADTNRKLYNDWLPEGKVRVAEYFWKDTEKEKVALVRFPTSQEPDPQNPDATPGQTYTTETLPIDILPQALLHPNDEEWAEDFAKLKDMGWAIIDRRTVERVKVKWIKLTPAEILDRRDWPGRYLPVVPVIGDENYENGKRNIKGMVRDAKDPQRMYSYWASSLTEMIALAPRAPYIGFEGSFSGHETKWNTANRTNYVYLEVKPITIGGQPAPFPQRQQFDPQVGSIIEAFKLSDNDLKAVMGLYDASLGQTGPEQSGKAILARQQQGQIANSNYLDNLARAIRHTGRIILDMIPKVYTPLRILRILGIDDQEQMIAIHNGVPNIDPEALKAAQGVSAIYDISVGRYDVNFSTSPSYTSRRQEAVASMLSLVQAYPPIGPAIADLLVKNMDWPGAQEVYGRLHKAVPLTMLPADEGGTPGPGPSPQDQQLVAKIQQLTMRLEAHQAQTDAKERIAAADRESKEKIAAMQAEATVAMAEVKANAQRAMADIEALRERLNKYIDMAHDLGMAAASASSPGAVPPAAGGPQPQVPPAASNAGVSAMPGPGGPGPVSPPGATTPVAPPVQGA